MTVIALIGLMNFQTMPPVQCIYARDIAAVTKYQDRGYHFVQGDDNDPTVDAQGRSRSWCDAYTLRMAFSANDRKTLTSGHNYRLIWRVGFREYFRGGFWEHAAECVVEETDIIICYRNWTGPACFTMAHR
jgi:hypothetical protein